MRRSIRLLRRLLALGDTSQHRAAWHRMRSGMGEVEMRAPAVRMGCFAHFRNPPPAGFRLPPCLVFISPATSVAARHGQAWRKSEQDFFFAVSRWRACVAQRYAPLRGRLHQETGLDRAFAACSAQEARAYSTWAAASATDPTVRHPDFARRKSDMRDSYSLPAGAIPSPIRFLPPRCSASELAHSDCRRSMVPALQPRAVARVEA
jgi:hypothetical protein